MVTHPRCSCDPLGAVNRYFDSGHRTLVTCFILVVFETAMLGWMIGTSDEDRFSLKPNAKTSFFGHVLDSKEKFAFAMMYTITISLIKLILRDFGLRFVDQMRWGKSWEEMALTRNRFLPVMGTIFVFLYYMNQNIAAYGANNGQIIFELVFSGVNNLVSALLFGNVLKQALDKSNKCPGSSKEHVVTPEELLEKAGKLIALAEELRQKAGECVITVGSGSDNGTDATPLVRI